MIKQLLFIAAIIFSSPVKAQQQKGSDMFWNNLKKHCGKSYEGEIVEAAVNDNFRGKKLVMHVRACDSTRIRIPFFVGEDKSRTWVLTKKSDRILLKHDHRHSDGKPDSITMYGGYTSNTGLPGLQVFIADQETANLIPAAASNVWWITIDDTSLTYIMRRIVTSRIFTVKFDLT